MVAVGAFLFVPAGLYFKTFGAFLFALFVLSSGLACIETAANPYVTVLGPKDGAASRLSVAQAFNSVRLHHCAHHRWQTDFWQTPRGRRAGSNFGSPLAPYVVLGCVVLESSSGSFGSSSCRTLMVRATKARRQTARPFIISR